MLGAPISHESDEHSDSAQAQFTADQIEAMRTFLLNTNPEATGRVGKTRTRVTSIINMGWKNPLSAEDWKIINQTNAQNTSR